jgi:hypothetical protein
MVNSKALIVLSLAVILVGCGASKPPTTAGQAASGPAAAAYKYAQCMRAHGVPSFPDPRVSVGPGYTKVAVMAPQSAVNSPRFKGAERACRGILASPGGNGPSDQLAHKPALLAFARCIRSHGVSSFPDPGPQGQITHEMLAAAGIDLHSRQLFRAAMSCVGVTHGAITAAQVQAAVSGAH